MVKKPARLKKGDKVATVSLSGGKLGEAFYEEYKKVLIEVVANPSLPIVCNINFGHALPRCVLPIGIKVQVDTIKQVIFFLEAPFENE